MRRLIHHSLTRVSTQPPACQSRQCKWSADAEQVYIQWGSDGVHTVKPANAKLQAKEGNKLNGKREDGEKCSAAFIRKVVSDEDMDFYEVLALDEVTIRPSHGQTPRAAAQKPQRTIVARSFRYHSVVLYAGR